MYSEQFYHSDYLLLAIRSLHLLTRGIGHFTLRNRERGTDDEMSAFGSQVVTLDGPKYGQWQTEANSGCIYVRS